MHRNQNNLSSTASSCRIFEPIQNSPFSVPPLESVGNLSASPLERSADVKWFQCRGPNQANLLRSVRRRNWQLINAEFNSCLRMDATVDRRRSALPKCVP